jgi:hypothetical protein
MHTIKTIEGLEKSGCKHLTVYIDGPTSDKDKTEQLEIIKKLQNSNIPHEIRLRNENLGLAKSITSAITEMFNNNDALIIIEDDCVPEIGFYKYMDYMLNTYKNKPDIGSVCGYVYPVISKMVSEDTAFISDRFCPWGWATWKNRWDSFNFDLKSCVKSCNHLNISIESLGKDIYDYCNNEKFLNNDMNIWSLSWILSQFIMKCKCIYPSKSLIKNIGFDGTGIHSVKTDIYDTNNKEDLSLIEYNNELKFDEKKSKEIITFMEKTSKMSYLINK